MPYIKDLSQPLPVTLILGVFIYLISTVTFAGERIEEFSSNMTVALVTQPAVATPTKKPEPIPMYDKGVNTYYIKGEILGFGDTEFMVDTGSGYMTINEETLAKLKESGDATYVKEILCILANGKEEIMPVYIIASIVLGKDCVLKNIEAAVFPGNTRQILGLSALKKAGAFSFSFDPPQLSLDACA